MGLGELFYNSPRISRICTDIAQNNISVLSVVNFQTIVPVKYNTVIISMVNEDTPIGNHTGAIHGTGIRKRTSMVVSFGGHLIRM
jgi:hypothetical protein